MLRLLIDVAPRGSYPAVVPVALPGPTELYLSQVNKSFWHYKIFKGEKRGGKEVGGRVGGRIGQGQVKEFLKFLWHDSLFHIRLPFSCSVFGVL